MKTIVRNVPVWDRNLKVAITVDVEVEIDPYDVAARLAQRAYDNKSGKSFALANSIKVTAPAIREASND